MKRINKIMFSAFLAATVMVGSAAFGQGAKNSNQMNSMPMTGQTSPKTDMMTSGEMDNLMNSLMETHSMAASKNPKGTTSTSLSTSHPKEGDAMMMMTYDVTVTTAPKDGNTSSMMDSRLEPPIRSNHNDSMMNSWHTGK